MEACVYGLFGVGIVAQFVISCGSLQGNYMICLRVSMLD